MRSVGRHSGRRANDNQRKSKHMRKIILGLAATAAIAVPLVMSAHSASAAPTKDAKATGTVAWSVDLSNYDLGTVTGTTAFSANNKTGGTLDYTNSLGSYLHGTVNPNSVVKSG